MKASDHPPEAGGGYSNDSALYVNRLSRTAGITGRHEGSPSHRVYLYLILNNGIVSVPSFPEGGFANSNFSSTAFGGISNSL